MCEGEGMQIKLSYNLESNHIKLSRVSNRQRLTEAWMNEYYEHWNPFGLAPLWKKIVRTFALSDSFAARSE